MSHTNQIEQSFRATDGKIAANAGADLDDSLISQALPIFQERVQARSSTIAEAAISNTITGVGGAVLGRALADKVSDAIVGGAVVGGAALAAAREKASEAVIGGAIVGASGIILGRTLAERVGEATVSGAIAGAAGGALGRGLAERVKQLLENPAENKPVNNPEKPNRIDWETVPKSKTDAGTYKSLKDLFEKQHGPSEIYLCMAIYPRILDGMKIPLVPDKPRDIILCSERIPATGVKPEPGNYYKCVYYYPLHLKDVKLQSY